MQRILERALRYALFGLLPLVLALLPGCGPSKKKSDKLQIVATYSILGDIVHNVVGDLADVKVLVGAGGDAHTFEPTAKDQMQLADADIVFENGLDFETWLAKTVKASRTKARRIVVTEGLKPMAMSHEGHDHAAHDHKHAHAHDHGEFDPHIWHDVPAVMHMVGVIRDAVCKADPGHASEYRANADKYLAQLKELDTWIKSQIERIPKANRKLVTSHDTFGYFGKQYGVEILGSAMASFSTEVADPSGQKMIALVEAIKKSKVPAIFGENIQNPALMQRIAKEAGVKLGPPLYTDALGEPGSDGDTYLKMMHHNVDALVQTLQ